MTIRPRVCTKSQNRDRERTLWAESPFMWSDFTCVRLNWVGKFKIAYNQVIIGPCGLGYITNLRAIMDKIILILSCLTC